jgi:hypothetical protein
LVGIANASEKYTIEKTYETFDFNNFETFEKIVEDDNTITLMENIVKPKHIIDDNQDSITIVPREGIEPLVLV